MHCVLVSALLSLNAGFFCTFKFSFGLLSLFLIFAGLQDEEKAAVEHRIQFDPGLSMFLGNPPIILYNCVQSILLQNKDLDDND